MKGIEKTLSKAFSQGQGSKGSRKGSLVIIEDMDDVLGEAERADIHGGFLLEAGEGQRAAYIMLGGMHELII